MFSVSVFSQSKKVEKALKKIEAAYSSFDEDITADLKNNVLTLKHRLINRSPIDLSEIQRFYIRDCKEIYPEATCYLLQYVKTKNSVNLWGSFKNKEDAEKVKEAAENLLAAIKQ